ncbi:HalOD1 output domain-containing protein [Haloarcula salinisoli]|uniref:Halobacterial output domain-containing protein n=1 Tax=Haloarcula salinisoli TaxID=2487746 RepID=A0A8J7YD73_9EURY|nr:HalOD1 output domain-containing protein [Halomicroarcula salinisoli]MBX0284787.1 hypothetical protein [Halomicroarcula salinisoli]MBX0303755.1 hypothetical protein [Halomicroarcula salinisoli]
MRTRSMGEPQSASQAVVEAVAARAGVDPLELETPLYDAIDPDELDALLEGTNRGGRSPVEVTLRYNGYMVTVDGDLTVTITE